MTDLRRVPLHALHVEAGAQMVPFSGYEMPVRFSTIQDEHQAVRTAVGLFDVSHMGNLWLRGPEAAEALTHLTVADATRIKEGGSKYTAILREDATILDDTYLFRTPVGFHVVPNAGMHDEYVAWIRQHSKAQVEDASDATCILALQGPKAKDVLQTLVDVDLAEAVRPFRCAMLNVQGGGPEPFLVSRTGYTGEDGFELMPPAAHGPSLWKTLLEAGQAHGIKPCGLGARDTLRLEKGFALAGHEFAGGRSPLEAGMDRFVHWDHAFIGKAALEAQRDAATHDRLVGLLCQGRGIPRQDCEVRSPDGSQRWGVVTSGTLSPNLRKGIALAYLAPGHQEPGTEVSIQIRDRPEPAKVVALPFVS